MLQTIIGTKVKMSQTFEGINRVPVTKIKVNSCVVTQIKTEDKDGYWALQLGVGEKKISKITKAMKGHLKSATNTKTKKAPRFLREIRFTEEPKNEKDEKVKVGDIVDISQIFSIGDKVAVTGTSKGKGFAGVVKRWGFAGGPATHGQGHKGRSPGSIGQGTTPGRVFKGKKMAGRMGSDRVTVKNLRVVSVDMEKSEMQVSGPVPGRPGSLLIIKKI